MELLFTDGKDARFVALCQELDEHLNGAAGEQSEREQYNQYNTLEHIHDVVLIVEDGETAACGSFKEYEAGVAEVKRVFTKAAFRKRGYSKAILKALEERAAKQGYKKLILETGTMLKAAQSMYLANGFVITENYGQYRNMDESICMEKLLTK